MAQNKYEYGRRVGGMIAIWVSPTEYTLAYLACFFSKFNSVAD